MKSMRGFWFAVAVAAAVVGVVYLQAGAPGAPPARAQTGAERQPLITEALIDVEGATLTLHGYDFSSDVPTVTLGRAPLAVLSATDSAVVAVLPALDRGTYLLAVTWPDGPGAVFYLASEVGDIVPRFQ